MPIWYFTSIVLSELYKGELLSMMTVSTIPNAPQSLEDIPKYENFFLATTRSMGVYELDKLIEIRSIIQNTIEKILEYGASHRKKVLMEISKRLNYLGNGTTIGIINDFWKARVAKNINVSSNLIYLDGEKEVNALKLILGFFSGKKLIKGESIDEFTITYGMIVQRNFLYKLINPYLQMLSASGIPQNWMKFRDYKTQCFLLKTMWSMLNPSDLRKESIFSFVISDPSRRYNKKPEPISMKDFNIFGFTYLLLIGVCNLGFVFEIILSTGQILLFGEMLKSPPPPPPPPPPR